jgi:sortase A
MNETMKYFRLFLLLIGFGLLAFFAAAKFHGFILSRAAVRQFEDRRQTTGKTNDKENHDGRLAATPPNFLLWSGTRIEDYEQSLNKHLAPALAVMRIPRLDVEAPVLEGTDDITLNRGVGHIAGTAYFGHDGNIGIAGHRDGFFRGLKNIKVGDRIQIDEVDRTETYIVDRLQIVSPQNVSVLASSAKPILTLVTCYPFYYVGNAPQRFIVHAVLVDSVPGGDSNRVANRSDQGGSHDLSASHQQPVVSEECDSKSCGSDPDSAVRIADVFRLLGNVARLSQR